MIPAPTVFKIAPENGRAGEVMVKALAPAAKTIESSCTVSTTSTLAWLDMPKVATSSGPLGTVGGVQLAAVFQSLLVGLRFQVALSARASFGARRMPNRIKTTNRDGRREGEGSMPVLLLGRRGKSKARSLAKGLSLNWANLRDKWCSTSSRAHCCPQSQLPICFAERKWCVRQRRSNLEPESRQSESTRGRVRS